MRILPFFQANCAPSDFENKRLPLNACLLGGLFLTGKVQTKSETIEWHMRWQGSSSKRLFLNCQGAQFA